MSKPVERQLVAKFNALDAAGQRTLLDFLEFLYLRREHPADPSEQQPLLIERPDSESVVAAMRRLSRCYPMLEADTLLHRASNLMSEHVLQGRAASEIIDDLEALFQRQYDLHRGVLETAVEEVPDDQ